MLVIHIDDFLHAGTMEFENNVMLKMKERFLPGEIEENQFFYVGFSPTQDEKGIMLDQNQYTHDIELDTAILQKAVDKAQRLNERESTVAKNGGITQLDSSRDKAWLCIWIDWIKHEIHQWNSKWFVERHKITSKNQRNPFKSVLSMLRKSREMASSCVYRCCSCELVWWNKQC